MVVVPSRCSVSYTFQITSSPRGHIAHSSVLAFRGSFQTRTSFDLRPDDVAISPPGASKHKPCPLKVPDSNVTTMWPHRNGARTSWCTSHSPIATGRPLLLRNLSCRVLSSMPDTPATHIVEIPVASKLYRAGWVTPHSGHSFPCGSPASEYPQAGHSFRRIARGRHASRRSARRRSSLHLVGCGLPLERVHSHSGQAPSWMHRAPASLARLPQLAMGTPARKNMAATKSSSTGSVNKITSEAATSGRSTHHRNSFVPRLHRLYARQSEP